jgi:hypothetical protein
MKFSLKPHKSSPSSTHIHVSLQKRSHDLLVHFTVENTLSPWRTSERFGKDPAKNWELWNFDVVEVFLQGRSHAHDMKSPYLELQVSPHNQGFQLQILEPRKIFYTPLKIGWEYKTHLTPQLWETEIKIGLSSDFKEKEIFAGFFSCLHEPRSYFSHKPNKEAKPDFHRPELFIPL